MPLEELFQSINSEVLTEDVKLQMATLFESAVNEAVKAKEVELEEANRTEIAEFKENMTNQIDEYLNYFVEEFVKENEEVIDNKVKVKTAERVLEAMQKFVSDFNLQLSEEVVKDEEAIDELKQENNKLTNKLLEARREVAIVKKAALIAERCGALETDVEKDKLVQLAETVEFEDDTFGAKLDVFVEQIKSARKTEDDPAPGKMEEGKETPPEEPPAINESIQKYLKYL